MRRVLVNESRERRKLGKKRKGEGGKGEKRQILKSREK